MKSFDVAIIGAGILGLASTYFLSRAGLRVLCLDQFTPPHAWSASVGESRLFRQAYFEDARYIPLLKRARILWREIEKDSATTLLHENGFLVISEQNDHTNERIASHARDFDIPIEQLSYQELLQRYPSFKLSKTFHGNFERGAGLLRPERALEALITGAQRAHATMIFGEKIIGIDSEGNDVVVRSEHQRYRAKAVVVAPGPFINDLVTLPMTFTIKRAVQFWFKAPRHYSLAANFPCFAFSSNNDFIYGFPALAHNEVKAARYQASTIIENPCTTSADFSEEELAPVQFAVARFFSDIDPTCARHKVCFYDVTFDENFVVDHDPNDRRIVYAAGGSGHAFKFAPVIGEAITRMIMDQPTSLDLDFLRLRLEQA